MLVYGKIAIDTESQEITYDGNQISLKPKENQLLTLFLQYPYHVLSASFIMHKIWDGDKLPTESTIRSHIKMLRQSLKECSGNDNIIETVHGLGYRLNPAYAHDKEKDIIPFPDISIMKKFFHAKAIEYLSFDQKYVIKFFSAKLIDYCDYPDQLKVGNYLGNAFPEFIGFEEDLEKVRNKETEIFTIKGIARCVNPQRPEYINFYVLGNNSENSISSEYNTLFIFFEDDSEKMIFRQQLVQKENETFLTLQLKKDEQKKAHQRVIKESSLG